MKMFGGPARMFSRDPLWLSTGLRLPYNAQCRFERTRACELHN